MKPVLRATHLIKQFGSGHSQVAAVKDISLKVNPGEILLIMGPSGSGKTTLLTLLGGLLTPDKGNIFYGDQDITSMKRADAARLRAQYAGFVFQSFNLMPTLNAWENVAIVPQLLNMRTRDSESNARDLLKKFGLEQRLNHDIDELSGGEQQRISIARALVTNPKLILADEPTANLDSKNGRSIMETLRDLVSQEDRAVIVVSHDQRIKALADRILTLEDGCLK